VGISELLKLKKEHEELLTLFSSIQGQLDEIKKQLKEREVKKLSTFG